MIHVINPAAVHTVTTRNGYIYNVVRGTFQQSGDVVTFEARKPREFDKRNRVSILAEEIASVSEDSE